MKRYYECTFIVNPGLDDPQIDGVVKAVEDAVTKNGGEIVERENIGRRRLAYPIAKKHNGYYASLEFQSEPHVIDKVERLMKLDENIMRYITLMLEPKELAMKQLRIARAKEAELDKAAMESGEPREARTEAKPEAKTEATPEAKTEAISDTQEEPVEKETPEDQA